MKEEIYEISGMTCASPAAARWNVSRENWKAEGEQCKSGDKPYDYRL